MRLLEYLYLVYLLTIFCTDCQARDPFARGRSQTRGRDDTNPFGRFENKDEPSLDRADIRDSSESVKVKRKNIKIAIILPQDALNMRNLRGCITREMNKINNGNWNFLQHFYLDSYTYVIYKTYKDIIDTICSLLQSQSNTAIYINYSDNSNLDELNSRLFLKFANLINLPVMTYLPNAYVTNMPRKNEVQLAPTLQHQVEAAMGILARYHWDKYSIVVTDFSKNSEFIDAAHMYQDQSVYNKTFQILSVVKLKNLRHARTNVDIDHIKLKLKLMSLQTRVIILHCHIDETKPIFKAANELGLTGDEYIWILTVSAITTTLSSFDYSHFPVGSLALWSNTTADAVCDKVIHGSMNLWASALEIYYNSINKNSLYTILPHTKCWNSTNISDVDAKYHYGKNFHSYLLKSEVNSYKGNMRFKQSGVLDSIELKIVNLNQQYEWKQIGQWVNKRIEIEDIVWPGLQQKPPLGVPTKFHLKVATLEEHPFIIYKNTIDGTCTGSSVLVRIANEETQNLNTTNNEHYKCASGFYVDLINELSNKLHFTYEIYQVEDERLGEPNKFGEWNGVIKDLISEKADLALTPITITTSRSEVVDFSVPFMETGISIIVGLRPGRISKTAFLKPYNYMIWIMLLLVSIHSVALAVFLFEMTINKFRTYTDKPINFLTDTYSSAVQRPKPRERRHYTFGEAQWLVWVLLFRVASNAKQPEYMTSKLMINIWACLCLVFMASYTANLAAFMIIKDEYPHLNGVLDQRLTNPHAGPEPAYRFGTVQSSSTGELIKETQPKMFEYMRQFNVKSVADGILAVKEQKLDAFLYDASILSYRAGLDVGCRLRVVGSWYSTTGYAIALRKHSKYKEMIDRKILEYIYSGELERTANFWFSGSCKNNKEDANNESLGVPQVISIFFLLTMGIIIGLIILVVHQFYDKHLMDKIMKIFTHKNKQKERELVIKKQKIFQECENRECRSELDELRKELIYFRKVFNSMKAIAYNPDPTKGFLLHNKMFLNNNSVVIDKKTHYFILDMFSHYMDSKINGKSGNHLDAAGCQKSILKQSLPRNNVRFAIESPSMVSRSLQSTDGSSLNEHELEVIDDTDVDVDDEFFNKRLEVETHV